MVPSTSQLLAFALASILFIQVPGPSLLFTIGRALTVGRRAALLSVLGNALGLIAQIIAVALGLGAVVAASAAAYTVLKIVGAAWVVWLGVQAIRHRGDARVALTLGERHPERTSAALRTASSLLLAASWGACARTWAKLPASKATINSSSCGSSGKSSKKAGRSSPAAFSLARFDALAAGSGSAGTAR